MIKQNAARGAGNGSPLEFELIEDAAGFRALEPEWRQLTDETPWPEPMQEPLWQKLWLKNYSSGHRLAIGVFREGGALVGVAPMVRRRAPHPLGLSRRRLEFIGADYDAPDGVASEYLGLIAREEDTAVVASAFVDQLLSGGFGRFDECRLDMMVRGAPGADALRGALIDACQEPGERAAAAAYYVQLPESWEKYLDSLEPDNADWIERNLEAFEDWAGPNWHIEYATDSEALAEGMHVLAQLENGALGDASHAQGYATDRFIGFHHAFAARMQDQGRLDLKWLLISGSPVAAQYNFMTESTVYSYLAPLSADTPNFVRVAMHVFSMREMIACGFEEYDFMSGSAPFKERMAHGARGLISFHIVRRTMVERLRRWADTLLDLVKAGRRALRWASESANQMENLVQRARSGRPNRRPARKPRTPKAPQKRPARAKAHSAAQANGATRAQVSHFSQPAHGGGNGRLLEQVMSRR